MSPENKKKPAFRLAVTPGDMNGVGPEIILKTFSDNRMLQEVTPVLYGSLKVFNFYKKTLEGLNLHLNLVKQASQAVAGQVNLVAAGDQELLPEPGKVIPAAGRYALDALVSAMKDIQGGFVQALVTAPLNKDNVAAGLPGFSGHTGWLAEQAGVSRYLMILMNGPLRVGLATEHIPLSAVAGAITPELLTDKLRLMAQSLRSDFGLRKPRIAVLGLNPHAGDNGLTGNEEQKIILPVINQLRSDDNLLVTGPFGADGFFGSGKFRQYDGILAMYHDQGLGPFKALSFSEGVNFTAGLPFVRTSPDHGTGYDLAGKGVASESSFRQAVYAAHDIWKSRQLEAEINANPLKSTELGREKGDRF